MKTKPTHLSVRIWN